MRCARFSRGSSVASPAARARRASGNAEFRNGSRNRPICSTDRRTEAESRLQLGDEFDAGDPLAPSTPWVSTTAKCLPSTRKQPRRVLANIARSIGYVFVARARDACLRPA